MPVEITRAQARRYLTHLHFGEPKTVYQTVRALQSVQYDPLNVVGRNPDLVLQSRVKNYRPEMLQRELYARRTLTEGADKMLCIFPVEDYPYFKRLRRDTIWWFRENEQVRGAGEAILNEIRARGPLCSDDIDMPDKVRWPWGEAKLGRAGLENLWMNGRLVLHHRVGARRYYDLAEKHIPAEILSAPEPNPTEEMYDCWQLLRRMKSVGLLKNGASDAFLGVEGFKAARRAAAFETLLANGSIRAYSMEGQTVYAPAAYAGLLEAPVAPRRQARVLAPLDNLLWDRKLIKDIFGFDYHWEVYTPREKRKYGYYVLPVMYESAFVARFEPKNFRGGALEIENWWWEEGVSPTPGMRNAIKNCLNRFCAYLGADAWRGVEP